MMSSQQRSMTIALWAALVLVMAGVIGAGVWSHFRDDKAEESIGVRSSTDQPTHLLSDPWAAPAFSLVNQDGKPVTNSDLNGHVYVADFIFTNCAGPCPLMTQKMAKLQKTITNPAVRFVSFSVDPERDTPAVLNTYAKQFGADLARWSFLTGDSAAMYQVAQGMKMAAVPQSDMSVMHSTYFLLIDSSGNVRGVYHTESNDAEQQLKQLEIDVAKLTTEAAKSTVSAGGRPS